jgi:hypothetical protein
MPCSPRFTPILNLRVFDPFAVRSFDVEDFDVPLMPDYVTRPFQSGILRIELLRPFISIGLLFSFWVHSFHFTGVPHAQGHLASIAMVDQKRPGDGRQRFCPDFCPGKLGKGLKLVINN